MLTQQAWKRSRYTALAAVVLFLISAILLFLGSMQVNAVVAVYDAEGNVIGARPHPHNVRCNRYLVIGFTLAGAGVLSLTASGAFALMARGSRGAGER
jgi:hypothetical protein